MCGNLCLMEVVVAERLTRARAEAARERLAQTVRPSREPILARVGAWLARLSGRRLGLPPVRAPRPAPASRG